MKLELLVNQNYDKLNENDKVIMEQILNFKEEYCSLSCEKMAKACNVSRATLLRLCRKIGLSSYSDLKYLLKEERIKQIDDKDDFHNICSNYQLLINELRKIPFLSICKLIDHAKTIYIYGTGNEQKSIAQEFKRIFLTVGKCVIDLFDLGEVDFMRDTLDKNDLFIIVSLSGETKEGIDIIRKVNGKINTLSITRLDSNTISSLCNQNLYVSTRKLDEIQNTAYEVVGAFYALLDLLLINYIEYKKREK